MRRVQTSAGRSDLVATNQIHPPSGIAGSPVNTITTAMPGPDRAPPERPVLDDLNRVIAHVSLVSPGQHYFGSHALFLDDDFHLLAHNHWPSNRAGLARPTPLDLIGEALATDARLITLVRVETSARDFPATARQPGPPPEALNLTLHLVPNLDLLGIVLVDHVIIGRDTPFSFRRNGLLG